MRGSFKHSPPNDDGACSQLRSNLCRFDPAAPYRQERCGNITLHGRDLDQQRELGRRPLPTFGMLTKINEPVSAGFRELGKDARQSGPPDAQGPYTVGIPGLRAATAV